MLIAVVLLLIVLFALTKYLVRLHRQRELTLAQTWFARGNRAMETGYPAIAAEDYRTALSYDRENDQYRLRLAEALLAESHYPEASSHLLNLWEEDPADGEVNLNLARCMQSKGSATNPLATTAMPSTGRGTAMRGSYALLPASSWCTTCCKNTTRSRRRSSLSH